MKTGRYSAGFTLCLLLYILTFQALASGENVHRCELMYEIVPHKNATNLIGEDLYRKISSFDKDRWDELSRQQSRQLKTIMAISPGVSHAIRLDEVHITQGGYEGVTSTSINIHASVQQTPSGNEFIALASMIGYIYFQDSVLVICKTAINKDTRAALEHTVLDTGSRDYMNPMSARLVFGMMMGFLNKVQGVGYTYDENTDLFRVLEFDLNSQHKKNALLFIANNLSVLSDGKVRLEIETANVYAYFSQNPWREYPGGGEYMRRFEKDVNPDSLDLLRRAYLQQLDSH